MQYGWVSHIQKYSLQDGPGIRTTVFLKGCPLDCWWCHNPENRLPTPELMVVETRCIRCGECLQVCPNHTPPFVSTGGRVGDNTTDIALPTCGPLLSTVHHTAPQNSPRDNFHCDLCGACVQACPTGARQVIGRRLSTAAVLKEILKDHIFYEESQGGVTISGGEPLMQPQFLHALLAACRARELHTVVDTCGYGPPDKLLAMAPLTHLFLYDLKFMEEANHIKFTGVSNALILENLRALACVHQNLWIRIPILPGLNDTPAELEAMACLLLGLPSVRQVNLLPYHQTGRAKVQRLGLAYRLPALTPPSADYMATVAAKFNRMGLQVKCGG